MAWSTKAAEILASHNQACLKTGKSDTLLSKISTFGYKTVNQYNCSTAACCRTQSSQAIVNSVHLSRKLNISSSVQPRSLSLHLPRQRSQKCFSTKTSNTDNMNDIKQKHHDKKFEELTSSSDKGSVEEKHAEEIEESSRTHNPTARKTSSWDTVNNNVSKNNTNILCRNTHIQFNSNAAFPFYKPYISKSFKTADNTDMKTDEKVETETVENNKSMTKENAYHVKPTIDYFSNCRKRNFSFEDFVKELRNDKNLALENLSDVKPKFKNDSHDMNVKYMNGVSEAVEKNLSKKDVKLVTDSVLCDESKPSAKSPKLQTYNSQNNDNNMRDKPYDESYDTIMGHEIIVSSSQEKDKCKKTVKTKSNETVKPVIKTYEERKIKKASITSSSNIKDELQVFNKEKPLKTENKLRQQVPLMSSATETRSQVLSYGNTLDDQNQNILLKSNKNDSTLNDTTEESLNRNYSYKSNSLLESKLVDSQPRKQKNKQTLSSHVGENRKENDYGKTSPSTNINSVSIISVTSSEMAERDGHTTYRAETEILSENMKAVDKKIDLLPSTHKYTGMNPLVNAPVIYSKRNTEVSLHIRDAESEQIKLKEAQTLKKHDKLQINFDKENRDWTSECKKFQESVPSETTMNNVNNYPTDKQMLTSTTLQRTDSGSEHIEALDPISDPFIQDKHKISNKGINVKNYEVRKESKISEHVNTQERNENYKSSDIYNFSKNTPNNNKTETEFSAGKNINYNESGLENIMNNVIQENHYIHVNGGPEDSTVIQKKDKMVKLPESPESKQKMNTTNLNDMSFQASSLINVKQDPPLEADKNTVLKSKKRQKISMKNFESLPISNDKEHDKQSQDNSLRSTLVTNGITDSLISPYKTLSQGKDSTSSHSTETTIFANTLESEDHKNEGQAKTNFEKFNEVKESSINRYDKSLDTEENKEDNYKQIKSIVQTGQVFSDQDINHYQQNFNCESSEEMDMKHSDNLKIPKVQESDNLQNEQDQQLTKTTPVINKTLYVKNFASDANISLDADKKSKNTHYKRKEFCLFFTKNLFLPASFGVGYVPHVLDPYQGTNIRKLLRKQFEANRSKNSLLTTHTNKVFLHQLNSSVTPNIQPKEKSTNTDVAKAVSTISKIQRILLQSSNDKTKEETEKSAHYFLNEAVKENLANLHTISKNRSNIFHIKYKDAENGALSSVQESKQHSIERCSVASVPLLLKPEKSWIQIPLKSGQEEIKNEGYEEEKSQKLKLLFQTMANTSQTERRLNVPDISSLKDFPDIRNREMKKYLKISTMKLNLKHGETSDRQAVNVLDNEQIKELKMNNAGTHWEIMPANDITSKIENRYVKKIYGMSSNQLVNIYGDKRSLKELINSVPFQMKTRKHPSKIKLTNLQSQIKKNIMQEQSKKESAHVISKFKILHEETADGVQKLENVFKTISVQIPTVKKQIKYDNINRHFSAQDKNKKSVSCLMKNLIVASERKLQGEREELIREVSYIPDIISRKYNRRGMTSGQMNHPITFKPTNQFKQHAEERVPISEAFPIVKIDKLSSLQTKRTNTTQYNPDILSHVKIVSTNTKPCPGSQPTPQNSVRNILQIMWSKVCGK